MNLILAIAQLCSSYGAESYVTSIQTEQAKCQAYFFECMLNKSGDIFNKFESVSGLIIARCAINRKPWEFKK